MLAWGISGALQASGLHCGAMNWPKEQWIGFAAAWPDMHLNWQALPCTKGFDAEAFKQVSTTMATLVIFGNTSGDVHGAGPQLG